MDMESVVTCTGGRLEAWRTEKKNAGVFSDERANRWARLIPRRMTYVLTQMYGMACRVCGTVLSQRHLTVSHGLPVSIQDLLERYQKKECRREISQEIEQLDREIREELHVSDTEVSSASSDESGELDSISRPERPVICLCLCFIRCTNKKINLSFIN